jgi:UDP-N-acetylglucosamine--N-acetylmuramyl-(pentapeptide) pyrophosphoryl-undecaprenol N-acetylglucosamine transferase
MKILLTGGGTGGHVYPLIAIAEELNRIADEEKLIDLKLYYAADTPYDEAALREQFITFIPVIAGKRRLYFSIKNFFDVFKTGFGIIGALWRVFRLYPDVVISKGGYVSFPVIVAARILRIPLIIHESDTVPGRVNVWAGKFATRVALSYPEAASYFKPETVSVTGQPVRRSITATSREAGREFFELDPDLPTIGVLGGSLGARIINDAIATILPELIEKYQVLHQTGKANIDEVKTDTSVILGDDIKRTRYKPFPFLNDVQTKMFAGAVDIVISRAGSALFEIAAWGKPSIIIPITNSNGDHQRKNAYHYARTGACIVIEEANLSDSVLMNEIKLLLDHKDRYDTMAGHARNFFNGDAARIIATEAVKIAISHDGAPVK